MNIFEYQRRYYRFVRLICAVNFLSAARLSWSKMTKTPKQKRHPRGPLPIGRWDTEVKCIVMPSKKKI